MNISNNFSNSISYTGTARKEPAMRSSEEQMSFLTGRVLELIGDRIENEVPENGKFTRVSVAWDLPDTQNTAVVAVEYDALNPKDSRRLSVGVSRNGSDRVTQNYLLKGTKKEILEFTKDPENIEKVINAAEHLSKKTDDYYANLF